MRRFRQSKIRQFKVMGRAVSVVAATVIIVSGVTFAALQSQQIKLTGNTIQTATANLQISLDGSSYGTSQAGFNFTNLVPGGAAVPQYGHGFYLKNAGGTPLLLKFAVSSTPSNPDSVDLSKVSVILTVGNDPPQSFNLQSLVAANSTGGLALTLTPQLFAPNAASFVTIQASMATDAISGQSAALGNIDFGFTGIAQ
jgi:hypothetical protein